MIEKCSGNFACEHRLLGGDNNMVVASHTLRAVSSASLS